MIWRVPSTGRDHSAGAWGGWINYGESTGVARRRNRMF
jgi:hypothetical protein